MWWLVAGVVVVHGGPLPHVPVVPPALQPPPVNLLQLHAEVGGEGRDRAEPGVPEHHGHRHVQRPHVLLGKLFALVVPEPKLIKVFKTYL